MPKEFPRSRRLEEAIQRILGEALAGKARDPRLEGLVITEVSVTSDLRVAKVYYAMLSGKQPDSDVESGLRSAGGFLRSAIAQAMRMKRIPELRFCRDEALAKTRSLEDLIERAVGSDRGPARDSSTEEDEEP